MTTRFSRLAALSVLLVPLISCWVFIIAPVAQWRADTVSRTEVAKAEKTRLMATKTRLENEQAVLSSGQSEELLWKADQVGEAYARVQSALTEAAVANDIKLRTITPLAHAQDRNSDTARVRVEFEANLEQLTAFLRTTEYKKPALPIQRAMLRKLVRPNSTARFPVLLAQIDIAAPVSLGDRR